jgi:hypothetical protein
MIHFVILNRRRPVSRLYRKATRREARFCWGHATIVNRHGQAVGGRVTHGTTTVLVKGTFVSGAL